MSHARLHPSVTRKARAAGRRRKPIFIPRLTVLEDRALLATLVVDPMGGTGVFTTIQAAVNAATLMATPSRSIREHIQNRSRSARA